MLDKLFEVNAWFGYLIATLTILAAAELGRLVGIATRRGRAEAMSTHRGCRTPCQTCAADQSQPVAVRLRHGDQPGCESVQSGHPVRSRNPPRGTASRGA